MQKNSKNIKRRTFLWLLGSGIASLFLLSRFIYSPSRRLQGKLADLGFRVEVEEIDKFWEAYLAISKGEHQHPVRVLRTYLIEPREKNISLFLFSSNALETKAGESVQFVHLYTPYDRPCFHPFLEKA